jgi:hypothetical protein
MQLTDIETCYKAFRREVIQSVKLEEDRFVFEPEVTAKVAKMKCRIYEVGSRITAGRMKRVKK